MINLIQKRSSRISNFRALSLAFCLVFVSGCSIRSYSYMDFSGNDNARMDDEKAPTNRSIWHVGRIPTQISLGDDSERILLSIDENSYLANVTVRSSSKSGQSSLELENNEDIARQCLSYRKAEDLLVVSLIAPENCSGVLKIKSFDSEHNLLFTKVIHYVVRKKGFVMTVDGI